MKRAFIFLLLTFVSFFSFAKEKTLYTKKTDVSIIELIEDDNLKTKYYINIFEKDLEEGYNNTAVYCSDYDKIKELLVYLLNHHVQYHYSFTVLGLEVVRNNLTLKHESIEIDSKNNRIVNMKIYVLE